MMVVWLVIEVMFLLVFFQLPPVAETEEKEEKEAKKKNTMATTSDQNNLGMYIHTYIHTYVHLYMHTYVRMYVCMYIHTYICKYIHTYVHTYYIHTYIHTYICITDTSDKRISNSYIQESTQDMFVSTTSLPQNENTSLLESTKEDNRGVDDIVTTKIQYGSINPVKEVKSSKEGVVKRICTVLASKCRKFYGMMLQLLREETVLLLAMLFFTILNHLILEVHIYLESFILHY